MFGYLHDTNQMNVHGIGLGLNISKKILEQFGGKIEVFSEEDKGTTFTITLKLFDEVKNAPIVEKKKVIRMKSSIHKIEQMSINLDSIE